MKKAYFRSFIFNVAFYAVTTVLSILYIPGLLLPRKMFVALVRFWLQVVAFLERAILDLDYRVEGWENLPQGACIIAAKHQSAYETLKLHLIFKDPAIVLKRELLFIPLFGAYLMKSGAIAIDRSTPEAALRSVQKGVLRVKAENRPIVIFPQGTRVAVGVTSQEKPYKPGIVRVQDVTNLSIVPMALNSGMFWPRNSWTKSSGKVVFKMLKPIAPGKDRQALMKEVETVLEAASDELVKDALAPKDSFNDESNIKALIIYAVICVAAVWGYCASWKAVAKGLQEQYAVLHANDLNVPPLVVRGFPGRAVIDIPEEKIYTPDGDMVITNLHVKGFPFPYAPIKLTTGTITINSFKWSSPVVLDGAEVRFSYRPSLITIKDSLITREDFKASISGEIKTLENEIPQANLMVRSTNHHGFISELARGRVLKEQSARLISAVFTGLADENGVTSVPVTQRGRTLFAGPFAFAEIPERLD